MIEVQDMMIDRAVELWCRALRQPKFDNGDGGLAGVLATMLIEVDKRKISDIDAAIEKFRSFLTQRLKELRDNSKHFYGRLSVDYGPCELLAAAADFAGIPSSQFSCKSSVTIEPEYVCARFGYGAKSLYHYPIPGGWVITGLTGDGIDLVLRSVLNGNPLGFTFEKELEKCK